MIITASIKSSFGAKKITCESNDVDLSIYKFDINNDVIFIFKNEDIISKTDCCNSLEYPIGKQWDIHRRYKRKGIDKLMDSDGNELLCIERNYIPESASLFNNYLKINVVMDNTSIITEFKQWKLFFPIKVEAQCGKKINPDLLVISLLLAWFRYEYNSHDQMY